MDIPVRKHPRLRDYDYSQNGPYFVTVCTRNKERILSSIVGHALKLAFNAASTLPSDLGINIKLTCYGKIVDKHIKLIPIYYKHITVDNYVIMPNHIHMLLRFESEENENENVSKVNLMTFIRSFKTFITKELRKSIWQDSFYEHIIRDERDYYSHWQYINDNPARWLEDKYYAP
jgi:REP element-mobilizing transposase RayT